MTLNRSHRRQSLSDKSWRRRSSYILATQRTSSLPASRIILLPKSPISFLPTYGWSVLQTPSTCWITWTAWREGISFITAMILSFFFWRGNDLGLVTVSLALAGGVLGFYSSIFLRHPSSWGIAEACFSGLHLAVLAIARQPQASNVFAILGVPTLVFLLPILDTVLVTVTRLLRGQSPAQGGRRPYFPPADRIRIIRKAGCSALCMASLWYPDWSPSE